jgi:cyclic lactone autoinducer peptide
MKAIGKSVEETAETKAGKCMLWVHQPKVPKAFQKNK